MLSQQKQHDNQKSSELTTNLQLINRIDTENNNIKMLIKAIRDHSLPHHQFTFNDSDSSNIEINSDNNHITKRRSKSTFLQDLSSPSSLQSDVGDFILRNKYSHAICKDKSRWNKIHQKLECLNHQNIVSPGGKKFFGGIACEQNKCQKPAERIEKKVSVFRIKNKVQDQSFLNLKIKQKPKYQQNPEKDCFDIHQIKTSLLISHINAISPLQLHSTPQQIYSFFESIHQLIKMKQAKETIIKRYTNCIYFGQRVANTPYHGMIWYYRKVCYIGQLVNGKKHGLGIQINLQDETIWKGTFHHGHKTGYFQIQTPICYYYGNLSSGQYHGEGHLSTSCSQFKGNFCEGVKEGVGFQKFSDKTEYRGQYFNNKFDGQGQLKTTNYYYKGLFKNGKPDGHGFERTNQYQYLGNFAMGKKEGKGKLKTNNGITINCRFEDNLIVDNQNQDSGIYQKYSNSLSKQLSALDQQNEDGTIEHMLSAISRQDHLLPPMSELSPINSSVFSKR